MTPLSPARRDAEAFALAVENRRGVADNARGDVADRYADLLTCVDVLHAQETPAPRTDFVADLRMRLMDAADTLLLPIDAELAPVVPLRSSAAGRRQRRISIAAAAFVVIGGTAGVAAAAENSLPGDPLYPIKRGIESAQVSLNSSDAGKGQDLLRQANTRLSEVSSLVHAKESPARIDTTLTAFQHSTSHGADLLFDAYQRDGDSTDITDLRQMLGNQLETLDVLAADAPDSSHPAFSAARELLTELDQQASVLCAGDCGTGISDSSPATSASEPTLATLLGAPALAAAAAQADAAAQQSLADRAGNVAKQTPQSGAPTGTSTPTSGPTSGPTLPGVPLPTVGADPVGGAVGGLTSGVSSLLKGVGAAGGNALAPLTDPLTDTLDQLTKGLLK
ncbi:MAG TPA: DUF5667 domain-containing protein [Marmoricola sp.]|jgi:hypothetical protein|nr:DUF5667 domain-containing protein [Marmoricola sp.]